MSIRLRVFLASLILVGAGIGYQLHWTIADLKPEFREALEDPLIDLAETLAAEAAADLKNGQLDTARFAAAVERLKQRRISARIYSRIKTEIDLRLLLLDSSGRVLYDSAGSDSGADYSQWNDVVRTLRGEYGARATRSNPEDQESSTLYVSVPVLSGSAVAGVVSVGKPASSNNSLLNRVRRRVWSGAAVTLVGALVLAALITAWVSQPIKRLTAYAQSISEGRRAPLPAVGSGEMRQLRDSFEEMRIALEGKDYVEKYVQGLTHELKSPIAAIQGAAELLEEGLPEVERKRFLANIIRETGRMRAMVDKLLILAAIERMDGLARPTTVDLAGIAEECLALENSRCINRKLSVRLERIGPTIIEGSREMIEQAVSNVVSNAIDFSPGGSEILIKVGTLEEAPGKVSLLCLDSGPGIPDYALAKLFDRFYSLARPVSGEKSSGLGLAIVREVMELHEGEVEIGNRPTGGASARLSFPAELNSGRAAA